MLKMRGQIQQGRLKLVVLLALQKYHLSLSVEKPLCGLAQKVAM